MCTKLGIDCIRLTLSVSVEIKLVYQLGTLARSKVMLKIEIKARVFSTCAKEKRNSI